MADPSLWEIAIHVMGAASNQTASAQSGPKNDSGTNFDTVTFLKGMLPILTILIGLAGNYLLEHACMVLTTLAEVETPIPGGVDSEQIGSEKYGILEHDTYKDKKTDAAQAKPHYVTSSIRATLRHLNAEAGDMSMFRAIGTKSTIFVLSLPIALGVDFLVERLIKNARLNELVVNIVVSLILAQSWAALIHIIISKPRHKFWFRRLPMSWFGVLRRVCLSTTITAVGATAISWAFSYYNSKPKQEAPSSKQPSGRVLHQGPPVSISFAFLAWMFFKVLLRSQVKSLIQMALAKPLQALETRIFASMLPDEDDPIVPMDRTFQGRPQSGGILQQTPQPLSFLDAARTVDKQTYLRLLKLDFKLHCIKQAAEWVFWALVFAQIVFFIGPSSVWFLLKLLTGTVLTHQDLDAVQGKLAKKVLSGFIAAGNATVPAFNSTVNSTVPVVNSTLVL